MMKDYYRVTRRVRELNSMLLQLFDEAILSEKNLAAPHKLDNQFQLRGDLIDLIDSTLFDRQPAAILQLFYQMAEQENIQGIYSATLRQLRFACQKLTKPLCEIPIAREIFITILRHPRAVKGAIVPMHLHDVLSAYTPVWQNIVGQMQFDLFHTYTGDEHTIRVLQKLDQFADQNNSNQHPLCVAIYTKLAQPEILRLAAMFHDIVKRLNFDYIINMSYSLDFRRKVLAIKKEKGLSIRETAKRFCIGSATVSRWIKQIEPKPVASRSRKIDKSALEKDVRQYPDAYQRERAIRFGVCQKAIWQALKKLSITYKKKHSAILKQMKIYENRFVKK